VRLRGRSPHARSHRAAFAASAFRTLVAHAHKELDRVLREKQGH
jgi:hypothetical protein